MATTLHARRHGTVDYDDALALQERLFERHGQAWLLLLEHPHVYTLGVRAHPEHLLVDPASVGAALRRVHRGGDVTYHGPGQLVGYVLVDVPTRPAAAAAHVGAIEDVLIGALADVGLAGADRRPGYPGVWIADRKIAAVGVRITRGRSMHGFALNVDPDLAMFDHIVPCGIRDLTVTSVTAELGSSRVADLADAVVTRAAARWTDGYVDDRVMPWAEVAAPASA